MPNGWYFMKKIKLSLLFHIFTATLLLGSIFFAPNQVLAIEDNKTQNTTSQEQKDKKKDSKEDKKESIKDEKEQDKAPATSCEEQIGYGLSWLICPTTGLLANTIDSMQSIIAWLLTIKPISIKSGTPAYTVWQYGRDIANIVFIIILLLVVYSHLTGFGFTNYNIKRILPNLIVVAVLVNLSFIICLIAIDLSNIIGNSITNVFDNLQLQIIANNSTPPAKNWSDLYAILAGGTIAGIAAVGFAGGLKAVLLTAIPVIFAALIATVIGLLMIGFRQAAIILLIIISPLAFTANILPNTEKYFKQWKDLFYKLLIFFPMFSLLFGASKIAGWIFISSAENGFGLLLGMAIQALPLFLSLSMFKMSGTALNGIYNTLNKLSQKPKSAVKAYSDLQSASARAEYFANNRTLPAKFKNWADYRKQLTENYTKENEKTIKARIDTRVSKVESGGFDVNNPTQKATMNKYVRAKKLASVSSLGAETEKMHADHIIGQEFASLQKATYKDKLLNEKGGQNFLEYSRAEFVKQSDQESDFDYLVNHYTETIKSGRDNPDYVKYVSSIAKHETYVLGQLFAKSSAVESRRRRDNAIFISKFGYNIDIHRSMMAGYYIDRAGFATDKAGNRLTDENGNYLETFAGELLFKDPSKLIHYDTMDENGRYYYDMVDQEGNNVARIYKDDSAFAKEAFANFDAPINDPTNALFSILSGIYPTEQYPNIGLAKYSTTIQRALQSSDFKKNNAAFSPFLLAMAGQRQIRNYTELNVAILNSLLKTANPGNFNTQDGAAFGLLTKILTSDNFDTSFDKEALKNNIYTNPAGGLLAGLIPKLNPDGTQAVNEKNMPLFEEVAPELATPDQKLEYIVQKLIIPVRQMATNFGSRITPATADNQKGSAGKAFVELFDAIQKDTKLPDPTIQSSNQSENKASELRYLIKQNQQNNQYYNYPANDPYQIDLDYIYHSAYGKNSLIDDIFQMFSINQLYEARADFEIWLNTNPSANMEQIYQAALDILKQNND